MEYIHQNYFIAKKPFMSEIDIKDDMNCIFYLKNIKKNYMTIKTQEIHISG